MKGTEDWGVVGARVREARLALGLSQDELGQAVGLDRTMVAKIEAGVRRVDALELSRVGDILDLPLDHFLSDEVPQLVSKRAQLEDEDEPEAARSAFRLEAMLSGWLRDVQQLAELELLDRPRSLHYGEPVNDADAARAAALWLRGRLDLGIAPLASLIEVSEQAGQFLLVANVSGDGASLIDDVGGVAIVSLRGDPGRRRSTAAHELGHFVLNDEYSSDVAIHASRDERERLIDVFAVELLLPSEAMAQVDQGQEEESLRRSLIQISAQYRTSWSLAVNQAFSADLVSDEDRYRLKVNRPTRAEFMNAVGWTPQPDLASVRVPPGYASAVMKGWKEGFFTTARALELMHGHISADDLQPSSDAWDSLP